MGSASAVLSGCPPGPRPLAQELEWLEETILHHRNAFRSCAHRRSRTMHSINMKHCSCAARILRRPGSCSISPSIAWESLLRAI